MGGETVNTAMQSGTINLTVRCAHCWHYKVDTASGSGQQQERCCHCGKYRPAGSGIIDRHGPYV